MYFSSTPFPLPQTGERGFLLSEVVAIWCYKIMYGENSGSGAPLLKCDIIRNKNMCGPDGWWDEQPTHQLQDCVHLLHHLILTFNLLTNIIVVACEQLAQSHCMKPGIEPTITWLLVRLCKYNTTASHIMKAINEKFKCFIQWHALHTLATECRPRSYTSSRHVVRQMARRCLSVQRCWQSACLHCDQIATNTCH